MNTIFKCLILFGIATQILAQNSFVPDSIDSLLRQGEKEQARNALLPGYDENEEDPVINYYLARIALMDTLYDDAIDYLDVALESDENNTDYLFLLGRAYGFKAQLSGALTAAFAAPKVKNNWERVLELDPTHLNANWGMFQYYLNAPGVMGGSEDAALELAKRYANIDPAGGHAMLANYYFFVENDQAIETYQQLIKNLPENDYADRARDRLDDIGDE